MNQIQEIEAWLERLFADKDKRVKVKVIPKGVRQSGFPDRMRGPARLFWVEVHIREGTDLGKEIRDMAREVLEPEGGLKGADLQVEDLVTLHFTVVVPVAESPSGFEGR
jgi:hypothetical protein